MSDGPYVVLCHPDGGARSRVADHLRGMGRVDSVARLDEVLELLAMTVADCLVVDLPAEAPARAVLSRIVAAYPGTRVVAIAGPLSFEDARAAVRLGIRDIVAAPPDPAAVAAAVRGGLSEQTIESTGVRGTAVLVASGKGGTGCTAIALHLAAALARHGTAAILDADAPPFGAVTATADLDAEASIAGLVRQRLPIEPRVLRRAGLAHGGGFTAFALWSSPDDPDESAAAIPPAMDALTASVPFVVVDLGRPVLTAQRLLSRRAGAAVAVTTLDLLALRGLRQLTDLLASDGVARILPVLNRHGGPASYTPEQAEAALGGPFAAVLPETPRLSRCMDEGVLLGAAAPDDPWWRAVERLAGEIAARRRDDFRATLGALP